jgi:hypothetical protein
VPRVHVKQGSQGAKARISYFTLPHLWTSLSGTEEFLVICSISQVNCSRHVRLPIPHAEFSKYIYPYFSNIV